MPVNSSWMPYAPQGVKGIDDDVSSGNEGNHMLPLASAWRNTINHFAFFV